MSPVLNTADKLRLGTQVVSAAYAGTTKVWPSWTPAMLSGLAVWVDSSQMKLSDGASVTSLTDLARGYVFVPDGNAPVYRSTVASGKPRLTFDGTQGLRAPGVNLGAAGFTFLTVHRIRALVNYQMVLTYGDDAGSDSELRYSAGTDAIQVVVNYSYGGPVYSSGYSTGVDVDHIFSLRYQSPPASAYSQLDIDGVNQGSGGGAAMTSSPTGFRVGTRADGFRFNGWIAEIVVYNRALAIAERQQVEGYLRSKWGL